MTILYVVEDINIIEIEAERLDDSWKVVFGTEKPIFGKKFTSPSTLCLGYNWTPSGEYRVYETLEDALIYLRNWLQEIQIRQWGQLERIEYVLSQVSLELALIGSCK